MGSVLLVRHGQASFGGPVYDVLSETGWEQSRRLGRWLAERPDALTGIRHGLMSRQQDTAVALGEAAGWTGAAALDEGWNEFDHVAVLAALGDLPEGADPDVERRLFQQHFDRALGRWVSGEYDDYAESFPAFCDRVAAALGRACAEAGPGGTVVVSSSGGPIAAAAAMLLDPEAEPAQRARTWRRLNVVLANASYSRVVVGSAGPRLLTFNEHPHLPADLITYR